MRALLLAAGLGVRLAPLTACLPKCLAPIHGRPLLSYWLDTLLRGGIDEVLINTHYMAPLVDDFVARSEWANRVSIVYEPELLGTGGTILRNRRFFREQTFLVAHADNLTSFDPNEMGACHARRPAGVILSMMLFESPDPSSCGIVELDGRGVITSFHEKPQEPRGNLANAAVYVMEPAVVDLLAAMGKPQIDLSTEVLPRMLGRMFACRNSSYHRDIGTIESWRDANRDFPAPASPFTDDVAWLATLASVGDDVPALIERLLAGKARVDSKAG